MLRIKLFFILVFLFLFFLRPDSIFASSDFSTDYNVLYTVGEDGMTHALFKVKLTNESSKFFASSYKITVGFDHILHATAKDEGGSISPIIKKTEKGQEISIQFNKKIVGINKFQNFLVSFDTPDVGKKNGNIWEINIPGLANQTDFGSFNVNVQVPQSFANPAYIKPEQIDNSLSFTKEQLGKSGISIAFGEKQIYGFSLLYHLKNNNFFPIKTELALPPSTNYQSVAIDSIVPKPDNVFQDVDGNWLAQYTLFPGKKIVVTVNGTAQLYLTPHKESLSEKKKNIYLQEKPYWQVTNQQIKNLANELKGPEAIYNYVISHLTYDFSRVSDNKPRAGAAQVIEHPNSAVCLEFTDLFITLARAAGIPAREVDGFAYTENAKERPLSLVKDILHAWPEYYDKNQQMWIMVDPTWGNTTGGVDYFSTLDFDHFAFVIKGVDSSYPIPAGGYKDIDNQNEKDVRISLLDNVRDYPKKIAIEANVSKEYLAGLPIVSNVEIANNGHTAIPRQTLTFSATNMQASSTKKQVEVDQLPPFGKKTVPLTIGKADFLTNQSSQITIQFAGKQISKSTQIVPFVINTWTVLGGVLIVLSAIILWIITKQARRLFIS